MINTLLEIYALKDEKRTGQQIYSIEDPDSIAGHSWSVSILTLLIGEEMEVDMEKALKIALVHDLAEAEIGDIATRARTDNSISDQEKHLKEKKAMRGFSQKLDLDLTEYWRQYNEAESIEAQLVKDADLVERCITALKNEKEGNYSPEDNRELSHENLDEFFLTSEGKFKTEKGRSLFEEIKTEYEEVKAE